MGIFPFMNSIKPNDKSIFLYLFKAVTTPINKIPLAGWLG